MLLLIYILLFSILTNVSSAKSPSSFCLCALKEILEEYALFTTDRLPPRYHSLFPEDIGFFISTSSHWIPVNNATWIELAAMINAPSGMYTHISLNGMSSIENGLPLDSRRSAHLAEIITSYRSLMDYVEMFHEKVIQSRSKLCTTEEERQTSGEKFSQNKWQQFFLPG